MSKRDQTTETPHLAIQNGNLARPRIDNAEA